MSSIWVVKPRPIRRHKAEQIFPRSKIGVVPEIEALFSVGFPFHGECEHLRIPF